LKYFNASSRFDFISEKSLNSNPNHSFIRSFASINLNHLKRFQIQDPPVQRTFSPLSSRDMAQTVLTSAFLHRFSCTFPLFHRLYVCTHICTEPPLVENSQVPAHDFQLLLLPPKNPSLPTFSQINGRQKSFIQILFDCFAIFAVVRSE